MFCDETILIYERGGENIMKILCSLHQNVNDTKTLIFKFKIITSGIFKCIKSALLIRLFSPFAYVYEKRQSFFMILDVNSARKTQKLEHIQYILILINIHSL